MGKSKSTTTASQTSQPLDWQSNDIQSIFNNANNVYQQQAAQGAPNYDTYQGLNDTQKSALSSILGASGANAAAGSNLSGMGSALASATAGNGATALNSASSNAASGASGNFNQGQTGTSNLMSGNASTALGNYNTSLSSAFGLAGTDATAQNAADAANYANSSGVQDAINAQIAQSNDLYGRTTTPSLNAQAVAGGNLNSSRAGSAQAISDAMQQKNNQATSSSMWNSAYQNGLSTAESARQANLSGLLSGANGSLSGLSSALAGQTASNYQTNANNQLQYAYNNQLGNAGSALTSAANTGANMATTGSDLTNKANQNAYNVGSVYQNDAQSRADSALNNTTQQNAYQWNLLNNLYSIIGSNNWGQQSNGKSTTTQSASPFQIATGAIGSIAGLASSLTGGGSGGLTSDTGGSFGSPMSFSDAAKLFA